MLTRDWPRLARYVLERRTELGLTQEEVAARGGPSTATIRNIETGEHESYRAKSLRQLADALGWTAESPLAVLNGREPQLRPVAVPVPRREVPGRFQVVPGDRGAFRNVSELDIRARDLVATATAADAAALRTVIRAAGPGASGGDIFADPVLAGIWDLDACTEPYRLTLMAAYVLRRRGEPEPAHRAG